MGLRTFALNYTEAVKILPILKVTRVLSQFGEASVDERTNTLIVRDLPNDLDKIADLLRTLDQPQPQVEIEARIVETDRDSAAELGVQWGLNGRAVPALGNTTGLAFPNSGTLSGALPPAVPSPAGNPPAVNLPVVGATSAIGLSMGAVNGALNLDVALSALSHHGKLRVLSTPHVTTQNNVQAEVTQGTTVPYQTTSNNTTSVAFRDAALKLTVTPHVTGANTVIMDVELENGTPDFSHTVNGNPTIVTQKATTKVQVRDGVTTVIGGIVVNTESTTNDKTPGVANIPLLGWLFRHNANSNQNKELLIFITPRIVREAGAAEGGVRK
jgi:type IV pilus assembly protein PilQ